jgi:hypothetical protein
LDGSSDVLVELCRQKNIEVFRFNIDLFAHYEVRFNKSEFILEDPTGRNVSVHDPNIRLLWRKPFLESVTWPEATEVEPIVRGNLGAVLRTMVNVQLLAGKSLLVMPFQDGNLSKLQQLRDADDYFSVPDYEFSIGRSSEFNGEAVTKPLRALSTRDNKNFYSTLVDASQLQRPFPWFLQDPVIEGADVTAVYIDGKSWFYECSFERSRDQIDWRVEINFEGQSRWQPWREGDSAEMQQRVTSLMGRWRLRYGRLDFIRDQYGTLWFLECNPNGQFGWLDDSTFRLHSAFLTAALK